MHRIPTSLFGSSSITGYFYFKNEKNEEILIVKRLNAALIRLE